MIIAEISPLKLVWTASASIGVLVTFALFFMSITDYRLLRHRGINSWRQQVAGTSIVIFAGGFFTQVIYFLAGLLALSQPNTGASKLVRHLTQAMFAIGAISAIVLALVIFYRRLQILDIIERAIQKEAELRSKEGGHE